MLQHGCQQNEMIGFLSEQDKIQPIDPRRSFQAKTGVSLSLGDRASYLRMAELFYLITGDLQVVCQAFSKPRPARLACPVSGCRLRSARRCAQSSNDGCQEDCPRQGLIPGGVQRNVPAQFAYPAGSPNIRRIVAAAFLIPDAGHVAAASASAINPPRLPLKASSIILRLLLVEMLSNPGQGRIMAAVEAQPVMANWLSRHSQCQRSSAVRTAVSFLLVHIRMRWLPINASAR